MDDMRSIMKEKTLTHHLKYQCSFLSLYQDDVLLENNKKSQRVVINHVGGACVLPLTTDGKMILTKQYRYPIKEISIEIPAGKKDFIGEEGLTCAKRELEEETGYQSDDIKLMYTFYPCVGYSDEKLDIFIARNCHLIDNPKPMDEDENIELLIINLNEAKDLLDNGIIKDGKTIIAIQYYMMMVAYEKTTY